MNLIATTNKAQGQINIPVLKRMTNREVAQAILGQFSDNFGACCGKYSQSVESYVKTLSKNPEMQFIDPCYDVCEDAFILSFEL